MALSGQQYTIRAGDDEATIAEVGASLRVYRRGGSDVTWPYREDEIAPSCSGAVLVPWPNRLRGGHYVFAGQSQQLALSDPATGNAIHGLARWIRWTPVLVEPSLITLATDLVPQKGWPFEVRVEVTYALDAALGLTVTGVAHNTGTGPAPFGAGFHPYVALHGAAFAQVTVHVPAARRLLMDAASLPVGEEAVAATPYDLTQPTRLGDLRLDTAFSGFTRMDGLALVEVRPPHGGATVWFDSAFGYAQVFTRQIAGEPDALAVEPMTCPPDAFNSGAGLVVLEPGASWTGQWGVTPLS